MGSYVDWWSAIASNSWLILNIVFHVLPHHQLVSFLKCRVCLVYVWFGIQAFFGILALILVAAAYAIDAAVSTGFASPDATNTYNSYIIVASFIVVLNFVQGISWVCLTSRLAREHHEELSHHGGYKSHH